MFRYILRRNMYNKRIPYFSNMSKNISIFLYGIILVLLITDSIVESIETFPKDPNFSIIDNMNEGSNAGGNKHSSFNFGEEFLVEEIIKEMEAMGIRPKRNEEKVKFQKMKADNLIKSHKEYNKIQKGDKRKIEKPNFSIVQNQKNSSIETFANPIGSSSKPSASDYEEAIVKFYDTDINYDTSDIDFSPLPVSHSLDKRAADDRLNRNIDDVIGRPKGGRQPRLFYNFDRGSAFNTSVAFTIPLFSFTLPGAGDITDDGLDGNVFGTMAFVSLFLLAGLGVAIYTTTQGALGDDGAGNRMFPGVNFLQGASTDASLLSSVYSGIEDLGEALEVSSCSQLAVCQAYTQPTQYGLLALPLRLYATTSSGALQDAAQYATAGESDDEVDCYRQYPCLLDPLEAAMLAADVIAGKYS